MISNDNCGQNNDTDWLLLTVLLVTTDMPILTSTDTGSTVANIALLTA